MNTIDDCTFGAPQAADTSWMLQGSCATEDPELFFPVGDGPAAQAQIAQARAVCAGCPMLARCLEYGMTQEFGVWGGTSEAERRRLRQQSARETAELERQATLNGTTLQFPAQRPNTGEARRLFRKIVTELQRSGKVTIATRDVPAEFYDNVRSRAWALAELQRLCNVGVLARTTVAGVFVFHQAQAVAS